MPWPRCRAGQSPTDLGAGLLLLGGWHLVLGSHHQLGRLLPWEGNSARYDLPLREDTLGTVLRALCPCPVSMPPSTPCSSPRE